MLMSNHQRFRTGNNQSDYRRGSVLVESGTKCSDQQRWPFQLSLKVDKEIAIFLPFADVCPVLGVLPKPPRVRTAITSSALQAPALSDLTLLTVSLERTFLGRISGDLLTLWF